MRDQQMSQTLTRLAREAGDAIMAVYGAPDFDVRTKGDDSPVDGG